MDNNYILGSGEIHLAKYKTGTRKLLGERYLGNSPSVSINITSNMHDHMAADTGVKEVDFSAQLSVERAGSFDVDNISSENAALFFMGDVLTVTTVAASGISETFTDVEEGLAYQLGVTDDLPQGTRAVANVAVTSDGVALTEGDDFEVDLNLGRVEILDDSNIVGAEIAVTYDTTATEREVVISGNESFEGAMRFIAVNTAGENVDFFMPHVRISPTGDFALKGDDWQTMSFEIKVLTPRGKSAIYRDGRPFAI